MKKHFLLFLVFIFSIVLSACTEEKTMPQSIEIEVDHSSYTGPLPTVQVYSGETPASIVVGNSCWGENGEPCTIDSQDPDALLEEVSTSRALLGEDLFFVLSASNIEREQHLLNTEDIHFEVTQFHKGEEKKLEVDGPTFKSPEEPGLYRYLATLTWEGETKGQANFAFSFSFTE